MNKKKVISLLVAGVLTTGIVGGTLAWFTSQDTITNNFTTLSSNPDDEGHNGLKIEEDFDKVTAQKALPGTEINKDVSVKNTASYTQFIRVQVTPVFTGDNIAGLDAKNINVKYVNTTDKIALEEKKDETTGETTITTPGTGKWFKNGNYYYYIGKVAASDSTANLIDSVTLNKDVNTDYAGKTYDVKVDASSVQSDNKAFLEAWGIAEDSDLGKALLAEAAK